MDDKMTFGVQNFPRELHRRAKISAAMHRITLRDLIVKAVEEWLERHEG